MRIWLFPLLLVLASAYVLRFGGREERIALITLITAFSLTYFLFLYEGKNWLVDHWSITIVDLISFVILFYIALRSKRFWPLPVAALQFLPVLTPFVAALGKNIVSYALGQTQGFWGYLQLVALVIATWRSQKRMTASLTKN
jgi:hypothetical protein